MAFNPFNTFRKHQKVLFVVLTILIMFVFIFTGYQGKNTVADWMGGHQSKGEKVVTLYGRDVTTGDLEQIKQGRQAANEVILTAFHAAARKVQADLKDYKPENPDPTEQKLVMIAQSAGERAGELNEIFDKIQNGTPQEQSLNLQILNFFRQQFTPQVLQEYAQLAALEKDVADQPPDAAKAKTLAGVIAKVHFALRSQFYMLTQSESSFYFGGGVNPADLLDFEIWKHQADKLGVVLTKADARRALAHEAADYEVLGNFGGSWSADPVLKDVVAKHKDMSEDQLATAVADEFRVRIAQGLLGGPPLGEGAMAGVSALDAAERSLPVPVSSYDFWKYYRDNRTTIKAAFLAIPVQSFVKEVESDVAMDRAKYGWTEQELVDLYEKYKAQVPNPNLPTPGFKEPHRIKVEYVTASGDTPYYKAYAEAVQFNLARLYAGSPVGGNLLSGGVGPTAALAGLLNNDVDWQTNLPPGGLAKAIQSGLLNSDAVLTNYGTAIVDQNKPMIGDMGYLLSSGAGDFPAFSAPVVAAWAAGERERDAQARLASAAFLMAMDNGIAATPFAGLVQPTALAPRQKPRDEIFQEVVDKAHKAVIAALVKQDVADFCQALDKLKGDADKAKKAIDDAVKERGWVLNDKAGLDDQFHLDTDPSLQPLRDALFQGKPPSAYALAAVFGLPTGQMRVKAGLYAADGPIAIPNKDDAVMAFWRAADEHDKVLGYTEALPRVRDAWIYDEARKRALERADQVNAGARDQASPIEAVKYLRDQKLGDQELGKVFELPEPGQPGIARIVPSPTFNAGISEVYARYKIPEDKIPNAPGNPQDFNDPHNLVNLLLTLDRPGKTLTFKDRPAANIYVAVAEERSAPEFRDRQKDPQFMGAFMNAAPPKPGLPAADALWEQFFIPDRQADYQKNLMRQLREDAAGTVDEKGRLVLSGKSSQQPQKGPTPEPEPDNPPNEVPAF